MGSGVDQLEVIVDRAKCCGYQICNEICPEVYKLDDQGFAYVDGPVSSEHEAAVREACDSCPEEAITVARVD